MNKNTTVELNDLPLDALSMTGADVQVESLTAGHGTNEAAPNCVPTPCCCC